MKDILAKAEELGQLIAASDRFSQLESAQKDIDGDADLQADIKALNGMNQKLAQLQRDKKPIEPEDKRRLRDVQEKITGNAKMQRLARVEADFAELMNRVNRSIHAPLRPKEESK